jgi:hypothetical protein
VCTYDEAELLVLTGAAASLDVVGGSMPLVAAPAHLGSLNLASHERRPSLHNDVGTALAAIRTAETDKA